MSVLVRSPGLAVCAILLGSAIAPVHAMSLKEAVQHTIRTNPIVGAASADSRASGYALRQAQGRLLPSLDVTSSIGRQRVDRSSLPGGQNREWRTPRDATVTVRQIVFDGWNRANDIYKSAARLDASALRVLENSELRGLDAVEAYIDVWRHKELLAIADINVRRHEEVLRLVRQRESGGKAPKSEVDQTVERLIAARAVKEEIRQAWLESDAKFKRVVGLKPRRIKRVKYPHGVPKSLQAAVDVGILNNPSVRAAQADIDAADYDSKQVQSEYMPEVSLEGSASFGSDLDGVRGRDNDLTGKVVLSWNLFNGFITTNRYRELGERRNRAHLDRESRRREAAEAIERAWAAFTVGRSRVALFKSQVGEATKVVQAYKQEYELSKRSLLDLLDSESALFSSRFQLISVNAVRLFSAYQLLATMGQLLDSLGIAAPVEAVAGHRAQSQKHLGIFNIQIEPLRKP